MNQEALQRYHRHLILPEIGPKGQEKLLQASVLVIGAGGLGCPLLQYLAAAGVGKLGIVDDDKVDLSNLQRQILYTTQDIGQPKAIIAAAHLQQLNPQVQCIPFTQRLTKQNALQVLSAFDIIVDGSDNFATRYLVNDACVILHKPLVFGSIFRFEAQVSVFNYQDGPTYRCLYPEPPSPEEMPGCAIAGVLGVLPGIAGTWMANEVIKVITGVGEVLSGQLLLFNTLTLFQQIIRFPAIPANKHLQELGDYDIYCEQAATTPLTSEITAPALKEWMEQDRDLLLLDVRNEWEHEVFNIGGRNIPLDELAEKYTTLPTGKKLVLYCQSGTRSLQGCRLLQNKYKGTVYHLSGGLNNFS